MIHKKVTGLILLFLVSLSFIACDDASTTGEIDFGLDDPTVNKYTFAKHDDDTMPIGAWSEPPYGNFAGVYDNPDLINDEQWEMISESGINVMYGLYNNAAINMDAALDSLDYAAANDVLYLVRDHQVTGATDPGDLDLLEDALEVYNDHPAFGGSMIVDEPGTKSYPGLAGLHDNYKEVDDEATFYINMLPDYANTNQLVNGAGGGPYEDDSMTYERYMREYIELVEPDFYSFDYYPFSGMEYGELRGGYFAQLSQVRSIAREYDLPFWVFIQASSWSPDNLRVPSREEVHWNVATSLAYGAKGIQHFMYYTSMEGGHENFVGGMVDSEGNKNPMYDYVKEANEHITMIDEILLNSEHMGIIVNGESPEEIPEADKLDSFSVLNDVSGDDVIIGAFNHGGRPALYVVNNDLSAEEAEVTLTFDAQLSFDLYDFESHTNASSDALTLNIPKGQAVLIDIYG